MSQQLYPQGQQQTSQFPTQYGSQQSMGGFQSGTGQPYGQQPYTQFGQQPTQFGQQPTQFGQQPYGSQTAPTGTQLGVTGQGMQPTGQRFTDSVPQDVQRAITDLDALEAVAKWTEHQAENRGDTHVARRCEDLVDLAHVQKNFILRQSPSADMVGRSARGTIEQIVQELGQQHAHPDVGDVVMRAQQALTSTSQALGSTQSWGQPGGQFQR